MASPQVGVIYYVIIRRRRAAGKNGVNRTFTLADIQLCMLAHAFILHIIMHTGHTRFGNAWKGRVGRLVKAHSQQLVVHK